MSPPRTALIAVTSASVPLYPEGKLTGLFISEALHPYNVLVKAGFKVDFASETGEWVPDYNSEQEDFLNGQDKKDYEDVNSPFRKALDGLVKADDVDPKKYGVFFAAGGHAALIDFPGATKLQKIASTIYKDGGIVSAVCHGPAIIAGLDPEVIKGKKITGFTKKGEEDLSVLSTIEDDWKRKIVADYAKDVGAEYVSPAGPWDAFTVVDSRIVTGANPQSAHKTGQDIVAEFEKL